MIGDAFGAIQIICSNKIKNFRLIKKNFYKKFKKVFIQNEIYKVLVKDNLILDWNSLITLKISIRVTCCTLVSSFILR